MPSLLCNRYLLFYCHLEGLHAKWLQSCLTLWDPMDCTPPGSSVHGILQARILECAAMPSSKESSRPRDHTRVSCICCVAGEFFTLISISYLSKSHTSPESLLCLNSAPTTHIWASQVELVVKNPPANAGDLRDGD